MQDAAITMLISIIMPLYNHEAFVGAAIESVLSQTFPHWELVVVNDGSTDSSLAVVDQYASLDPRIRIFSKTNGGTVSALNIALALCKGDLILWLSSDDLFSPKKLETHLGLSATGSYFRPSVLTHGSLRETSFHSEPLHIPGERRQLLDFLWGNYINGLSIAIPKSLYLSVGLFDSRYPYAHDVECWIRIAKASPIVFKDSSPMSFSRVHLGQSNPMLGDLDVLHAHINMIRTYGFQFYSEKALSSTEDLYEFIYLSASYVFNKRNIFSRWGVSSLLLSYYSDFLKSLGLLEKVKTNIKEVCPNEQIIHSDLIKDFLVLTPSSPTDVRSFVDLLPTFRRRLLSASISGVQKFDSL
jgi:glycosyltransferase involved in cell wall biosynthesis